MKAIAIDPANSARLYLAKFGSGIFRSTDSGGTWNPTGTSRLFAGLAGGGVWQFEPGGPWSFHTLVPCRIIDTRNVSGPDAGAPSLVNGEIRTFATAGECGIPSTALALSVNVTVVGPPASGYLTLWAADIPLLE